MNDFRIAGPDALKPKKRGRQSKVEKPKDINHSTNETTNSNPDYLKQLEEENLKLRIKNAYLKEFRKLRLEEKARIICCLRGSFKLKNILAVTCFPKSTYMLLAKKFGWENPDQELENKILKIGNHHKDYAYL